MRINRDSLLKLARETVAQRTHKDRTILAVYLSGALLEEEYLMGGTGDIDLTFIHIDRVEPEREIVRLTDDVHLDIAHHTQKDYMQTRRLRMHPWMGPTIYKCQTLYDPQHIMDFTQASVRGQFDQPEYVLGRTASQASHARQIWSELAQGRSKTGVETVEKYLKAVEHMVNAIAGLSGPPLTERRFLKNFQKRATAVGKTGLYAGLLGVLGGSALDREEIRSWLPSWEKTYQALPDENRPARLHNYRKYYYLKAIEALLEGEEPRQALWPLLHSWTLALYSFKDMPSEEWQNACMKLGLLEKGFVEKVEALDAYLDTVEDTLDDWARENGVET